MTKVFIDGSAGTTGLRIVERLENRKDLELTVLPENLRKDTEARRDALNSADIAFLCLPDAAAIEAVSLLENSHTAIIDTSTAHRVNPEWAYGFSELTGKREEIMNSKRVANPGCHASGFISLVAPLVECGIIKKDAELSSFSLTGYSGGGKKKIAEFEDENRSPLLNSPGQYALGQAHKHVPEMKIISGLTKAPIFSPIIAPFYSGMEVTVPIFADSINGSIHDICKAYCDYYGSSSIDIGTGLVRFVPTDDQSVCMYANEMSGKDDMKITVTGNDERILLISRFDNLGKGASGAAIQNMNIILGLDEKTGLDF